MCKAAMCVFTLIPQLVKRRACLAFFALLAQAGLAYGQFTASPATLSISPGQPTSSTPVTVTVGGQVDNCLSTSVNSILDSVSATRSGSDVLITARVSCGIVPVPGLYSFDYSLGLLDPGPYQVRFELQARTIGAPDYQSVGILGSATFAVRESAATVPSSSNVSLLSLVLLICVLAWRAFGARGLLRSLTVIVGIATLLQVADSRAAQPSVSRVDHQIMLVLDPGQAVVTPTEVADPFRRSQLPADFKAALGAPESVEWLISDRGTDDFRMQLEKNAASPRALLHGTVVLTYVTAADANAAEDKLRNDRRVLSVERNQVFTLSAMPSDRYFAVDPAHPSPWNYQWGMQMLALPGAWDRVRGTAYVGYVDIGIHCVNVTGECISHPDLRQSLRLQFSKSFYETLADDDQIQETIRVGPPGTSYYSGHGTHVAGIIAATPQFGSFGNGEPNSGVAGGCWTCSLAVLRFDASWSALAKALTFAADHGLQAVNISFGDDGGAPFTSCADMTFTSLCNALAYAHERDVVLVGAAGNYFRNHVQFPASAPEVIAVAGIDPGGQFWSSGYGTLCTPEGSQCGSNYGPEIVVAAPARDVVSTVHTGFEWNPAIHCGDTYGPDYGTQDGYGDCTGTSMASPHVTAIVGLLRSANPLLNKASIKAMLAVATTPCSGSYASRCGQGIPDAARAVNSIFGAADVKNLLTPVFSFYSAQGTDHFYTIFPQMGASALVTGQLLPQPTPQQFAYQTLGASVPGYAAFPCSTSFPSCFYVAPKGMFSVFTSHANPFSGQGELVPLYRLSQALGCCHSSHIYTTSGSELSSLSASGYRLDGIEGYVYPKTQPRPPGTVKLCRKYSGTTRDDYILFASDQALVCGSSDGYTRDIYNALYNDYTSTYGGTDWIGWVYPLRASQTVCIGGLACKVARSLFLLLDD